MILTEYNEELHIKNEKNISYEEGRQKGIQEGRQQGIQEGFSFRSGRENLP